MLLSLILFILPQMGLFFMSYVFIYSHVNRNSNYHLLSAEVYMQTSCKTFTWLLFFWLKGKKIFNKFHYLLMLRKCEISRHFRFTYLPLDGLNCPKYLANTPRDTVYTASPDEDYTARPRIWTCYACPFSRFSPAFVHSFSLSANSSKKGREQKERGAAHLLINEDIPLPSGL